MTLGIKKIKTGYEARGEFSLLKEALSEINEVNKAGLRETRAVFEI